jgi:pimeloyl-ACP methyl ester carboxylesterase
VRRFTPAAGLTILVLLLTAGSALATGPSTHARSDARHGVKHAAKRAKHKRKSRKHRPGPTARTVRQIPVGFTVRNTNTSLVPCTANGGAYTIRGTLFVPPTGIPAGATLYVHGLGFGAYYWHFTAVPGYDYATYEAEHGHASVIIDRLGYGASSIPAGTGSCIGGQASILHQIIQGLRHGTYTATGTSAPSFQRIGLVGHSVGGELVQVEAESFHDIDALSVEDFTDGTYSPLALSAFGADGAACALGGSPQTPGGAPGYGDFGATIADYNQIMFNDADPAVVAAADATRSKDPCGDILSILNAVPIDLLNLGTIKVPVAYAWGSKDALFLSPAPWAQIQESLYSGSPKVTNIELAGSGHAVTLGRQAPQLQHAMDVWLTANSL